MKARDLMTIVSAIGMCILTSAQGVPERIAEILANRPCVLFENQEIHGPTKRYELTKSQIEKVPEWAGTGEPTLPVSKALEIARQAIKNPALQAAQIEINAIPHEQVRNRWYYHVTFRSLDPKSEESAEVVVLFNGVLLEPVIAGK